MEFNKLTWGLAAGIAATSFIAYCIYFDKKRRSDPDYKKKVRERRLRFKQNAASASKNHLSYLGEKEYIKRCFEEEVRAGESSLILGHSEQGAEHFAKALLLCNEPTKMLEILNMTLPPDVFEVLIKKMKEFSQTGGNSPSSLAQSTSPLDELMDVLE